MHELRTLLETRLLAKPGITIDTWKDTDLVCVFFRSKDVAHFQSETVLDIRLTPKIIRDENLDRSVSAQFHPNRSQNSRWICIAFTNEAEVDRLLTLVDHAVHTLSK